MEHIYSKYVDNVIKALVANEPDLITKTMLCNDDDQVVMDRINQMKDRCQYYTDKINIRVNNIDPDVEKTIDNVIFVSANHRCFSIMVNEQNRENTK